MPNLHHLKYAIFDWDNTLADTRPLLVKTVGRVLDAYNLPEWDISKQKRDSNLSFMDNFPLIFEDKAQEAYELYRKIYITEIKNLHPIADAPKAVEYFHNRAIPILIMTNKDRFLLDIEINHLYGSDCFFRIVAGHEAPRDKPHPEHAWYSLEGLLKPEEITRDNVWIIGDSHQDSKCAQAVNAMPIRIGKAIWNYAEDIDKDVAYFSSFSEFLSFLPSD